MPSDPTNAALAVKQARKITAEILGYKDWDDATDYRTTGRQDAERDRVLAIVTSALRQQPEQARDDLIERLEEAQKDISFAANRLDDQSVANAVLLISEAIAALSAQPAPGRGNESDWFAGDVDSDGNELTTVRADALSALVGAARAAQALATACMAPGCYSHEELTEMARATKPTFDAALSAQPAPGVGEEVDWKARYMEAQARVVQRDTSIAQIEAVLRRYAGDYRERSDKRHTLVTLANYVAALQPKADG